MYERDMRVILERLKGDRKDLKKQSKELEKTFLKWNKIFDKFLLTIRQ